MNKVNFNSLSAYKTPENWINKAAAIPEACGQKRSAFPLNRYLTAASIVLVSAVGLLIFLHFGSAPVTVHEGGIAASESRIGETVVREATGGAPQTDASAPAETIAVLSTDADGNAAITYEEKSVAADGTQPTHGRTSPTSVAPTAPHSTETPGQPVPSTEHPPAETEVPAPTSVPSDEPPTQAPTESPLTDCRFTVTIGYPSPAGETPAVEAGDLIVFCRMYDASGNIVGSSDFFAEEKRATVVSSDPGKSFVVTYDPLEKGLPITRGRYTYVFYDYHTGTELCRGIIEYQ